MHPPRLPRDGGRLFAFALSLLLLCFGVSLCSSASPTTTATSKRVSGMGYSRPWPMFKHGPQRSGNNPESYPTPLPLPSSHVRLRISRVFKLADEFKGYRPGGSAPLIASDTRTSKKPSDTIIIVALPPTGQQDIAVMGLNFSTSGDAKPKMIWSSSISGPAITASTPTMTDMNSIVLATGVGTGVLNAITTHNGSHLWSIPDYNPSFSAPCAYGESVFIGDNLGYLHAINMSDDPPTIQNYSTGSVQVQASVAFSPRWNRVFVGPKSGSLIALSGNDLQKQWSYNTSGVITTSPTVSDDLSLVFITSTSQQTGDTSIFALDTIYGKLRWKANLKGQSIPGGVALSPDSAVLYTCSSNGTVFAFNTSNGNVLWKNVDERYSYSASPAIDGAGAIYLVSNEGVVVIFDPMGGRRASLRVCDKISQPVALSTEHFYVICQAESILQLEVYTPRAAILLGTLQFWAIIGAESAVLLAVICFSCGCIGLMLVKGEWFNIRNWIAVYSRYGDAREPLLSSGSHGGVNSIVPEIYRTTDNPPRPLSDMYTQQKSALRFPRRRPRISPMFRSVSRASDRETGIIGDVGESTDALELVSRERWYVPLEQIELGDMIAKGGDGNVYRARWRGRVVALKTLSSYLPGTIRGHGSSSEGKGAQRLSAADAFRKELRLISQLSHPNIVEFVGGTVAPASLGYGILTEFCPLGSLYEVLRTDAEFDWATMLKMAADIAAGMHYLHSLRPPVLHRDLKSPNLLVVEGYTIKISDFGISRLKPDPNAVMTYKMGSPLWMAPEIFEEMPFTEKADMYSFGIVLWELLERRLPFEDVSMFKIVRMVVDGARPPIPDWCPASYSKLMRACWAHDPAERPSFERVLEMIAKLGEDAEFW